MPGFWGCVDHFLFSLSLFLSLSLSLSLSLTHTHTHTHSHPVRLLCTSDLTVSQTTTYTTNTKDEHPRPQPVEPAVPTLECPQPYVLGYVLRGSDQRARTSMRVHAIGVFVSYVTATG